MRNAELYLKGARVIQVTAQLLRKNVSTWLTVLSASCFQVQLEFSALPASSTLKWDLNGWFIL